MYVKTVSYRRKQPVRKPSLRVPFNAGFSSKRDAHRVHFACDRARRCDRAGRREHINDKLFRFLCDEIVRSLARSFILQRFVLPPFPFPFPFPTPRLCAYLFHFLLISTIFLSRLRIFLWSRRYILWYRRTYATIQTRDVVRVSYSSGN